MILRALVVIALTISVAFSDLPAAHAVAITSITDLANLRETFGVNSLGFFEGSVDSFGAQVVPNGLDGTRIFATQDGVRFPNTSSFACTSLTTSPNNCGISRVFDSTLSGPWQLTFLNGPDQASANTPSLTPSAVASAAPFPVNVTISGTGPTPTLSWTVPQGFTPDVIRVDIFDKAKSTNTGSPDIIFSRQFAGNATSFTVPMTANLQQKTPYVLDVQLIETRDHTTVTGSPNANISKRSRSFFDFQVLDPSVTRQILLPTVGPAPDPSTGLGATYQFNAANIRAGQQIFIDPLVAIGYKYATGVGNPNFASVLLPAVQSGKFMLSFLVGQILVQQLLDPNVQFFFPGAGVAAFDVTGIDPLANLDPGNVTAFMTGLTFEGDGDFTGTMTPIVADLAATPEPATILLWGTTMAGLGLVTRWRRRRQE